jgi:hypothetical protein
MAKKTISVIGGHKADEKVLALAGDIGRIIAEKGFVLVCGGLSGIMEASCKGAKSAGGLTVGIIPGERKEAANPYVDIVIPTGMGYSRNTLVACSSDIVVALPGEYGTLSEIGFALIAKKKVYGFNTWEIPGVRMLSTVEELGEELKRVAKCRMSG